MIALNAAKDAVPPPMSKYGTSFGISLESAGFFIIPLFLVVGSDFFCLTTFFVLSSISRIPLVYN